MRVKHNTADSLGVNARPWLTVYSAVPLSGTGNATAWYNSRANYLTYDGTAPTLGEDIHMYVGSDPSTVCTNATFPAGAVFKKRLITAVNSTTNFNPVSRTNFASDEVLFSMALSTSSSATLGKVDVDVLEAGWCFEGITQQVQLRVTADT